MKKNDIKISYDADADVMSWETTQKGKIDYATEIGNFVVHFSKDNKPLLIEVLEASKILKKSERKIEKAREHEVVGTR
ncbi:MAG: hypothetical protein G01um101429_253 [Parcubacteria group bacterium Gr01-1014_29]|nr:MAG: hypothetical protein G01um101429_253 [Parcubacteria group bacterium Gr01-1014_29]